RDTGDTGDTAAMGGAPATGDTGATRDTRGTAAMGGAPATHRAATAAASAAWKSNSLGAIIGQFKSVCTKRIWAAGFRHFAWQARFYDHIVRSQSELERIRAYILANPSRWENDKGNTEALYR
ncbi:MAG: transposase, partial [Anaerolineales bacterium]